MYTRHKWMVLDYIGGALPPLTLLQKTIIRKQLDERYCPQCGEYIYNPYRKRNIRHYHHLHTKLKFEHLFNERILVHPQSKLVEWRRKFPNVMKLIISEKDLYFYNIIKPQFIHRIPALKMWTIEEWNITYPTISIEKEDGLTRFYYKGHNTLFTPDLIM